MMGVNLFPAKASVKLEIRNCTGASMKAFRLIEKLIGVLDRREKEYMDVFSRRAPDDPIHISYAARAGEVGVFRTDLEMLLERISFPGWEHKGYTARINTIEDTDAGTIIHGTVPGLETDIITFEGGTLEETEQIFRDSVDDYLQMCEERGEVPQEPKKIDKGS